MSLTKASYSMIQGAPINVFDYMTEAQRQDVASGTGALDVTAALAAAVNVAKAIPFSEKEIVFPAGLYRVTQFDYTGVNFCTFRALGTVQIYGNGTAKFVFGCDGYDPSGGNASADSTFSSSNKFIGGQWVIANTGGTYTHTFMHTAGSNCVYENFSISGQCGATSGANRISASLNFCWVNRFIKFNVGTPGVPGAGYRSFCISTGPLSGDNFNNNVFENCRIQAGSVGSPFTDQVGIFISGGTANAIKTCDISALDVGIELVAARGTVCDSNYHEAVKTIVNMPSGNSRGNTFIGGIYEVLTDGVAFDLESSQQTTIIGGAFFGVSGGSNRTFIDQGTACYGLSVISPDLSNIDVARTGTYHNPGVLANPSILQASGLTFPSTNVTSAEPNTLDDYEEGSWTPTKTTGTAFASASGRYTKIGNQVTANFIVVFDTETNASAAAMSGFPFAAGGAFSELQGLAIGYNTSSTNVGGALVTSTLNLQKVGAGGGTASITNMSGATLTGSVTYFTST